ncbi:MAG: alpha/beta fold hydrolase [Frankiaceae bacterium]|jgi:pimeloyl-ACP methyl ester carboxylesterase|nr:alpha/beta fold hydrolase [Frankiaceae bacterium]
MPLAASNGIEICYETFGDPADPTLLLFMGLGAQMIGWDEGFIQELASRKLHIVRFDNRDTGKSTWFDDAVYDLAAGQAANLAGEPVVAPYNLSDMVNDAVGLLDHLGIGQVHIAGASMGGMLVQQMAIDHPDRVLSMCSIMSSPGEPDNGQAAKGVFRLLLSGPADSREAAIAAAVQTSRVVGAKEHFDEARVAERAGRAYDRAYHPVASERQLLAIWASSPRTEGLRKLDVPALVIHGRQDPLIQLDGGERTAELIPGAQLLVFDDMGHDTPEPLWPAIADAIAALTARGEARRTPA